MKRLIIGTILGLALLVLLTIAQADQSPMGKYSDNPTMADIYEEIRNLVNVRPDLSDNDLLNMAIRRAYEKKQGKRI